MPIYEYTAIGRDGAQSQGREEAGSENELEQLLRRRQMVLVTAKPLRDSGLPLSVVTDLVAELARLLGSGILLERALEIIAEDSHEQRLAEIAGRVRQSIQRGQALSSALHAAGRFDPLLLALVRAGEASGQLPRIMSLLEGHYAARTALQRDLLAALSYPFILIIVSLASLVGMAIYVVPSFRDMFADDSAKLPMATQLVFSASEIAVAYGGYALVLVVLGVIGVGWLYRNRPEFAWWWHAFILRSPVVGPLLARLEAANVFNILGITLDSGVQLVKAMELASQAMRNRVQRAGMDEAIRRLRKGVSLPVALEAVPELPRLAQRFARIGNETGKLPELVARAAAIMQGEAQARIKGLVAAAGPLVIVVMGSVIGFIVISMLLAVFTLSDIG